MSHHSPIPTEILWEPKHSFEYSFSTGLHEDSVEGVIDRYRRMCRCLDEGEHERVGTHVGRFCENVVNLLRVNLGESAESSPRVGRFIDRITSDGYDDDHLPESVRLLIPRAMRFAYDVRSKRDSVHVNLELSVNRSDMQTAVRLCAWILSELIREYGTASPEEAAAVIADLASVSGQYGPLEELETDVETRNRRLLAEALDGIAGFDSANGASWWEGGYEELSPVDQARAVLLRQRAAVYKGIEQNRRYLTERELKSASDDITGGTVKRLAGSDPIDTTGWGIAQSKLKLRVEDARLHEVADHLI